MKTFLNILLELGLTWILAWTAHAQVYKIDNLALDTSRFPILCAEFDLRSPKGELVSSLAESNIRIIEEGNEVQGKLVPHSPEEGVAFMLVVDTSGSMKKILSNIKEGLIQFIRKLEKNDRLAILTFNDNYKILKSFTSDKSILIQTIQDLKTEGKTTELYFACFRGLQHFQEPGLPRRKILLAISDGMNEGSAYTQDDVIRQAKERGINIIGIGIQSGKPNALLNVQRLAEFSAGLFLQFEVGQEFKDKIESINQHIKARQRIEWKSTFSADGVTRQVQIKLALDSINVIEKALVKVPEDPRRKWIIWGGLGAGALLIIIILLTIMLYWAKKRRIEKEKISEELRRQRESQERFERDLREAKQQVQNLKPSEERLESQPVSPSQIPRHDKAKQKTIFIPSTQPASKTYRSASLQILEGPLAGTKFPLREGRTTIGREDDNNITLNEPRISGHHAAIDGVNGLYWLEDLESTNGTWLDTGAKVSFREALADGQKFRIGGAVLVFRGER